MELESLTEILEESVATLLGVSRRMVRNYVARNGLPCVGVGRSRRFVWLEVLEWYLVYRVEIAQRGGKQSGVLKETIRKLRKRTASATAAAISARQASVERRRVRKVETQQPVKLARSALRRPRRPRSLRRRSE
jgi:excisionase family DNA binding protein